MCAELHFACADVRINKNGLVCGQGALNCGQGGLQARNNHHGAGLAVLHPVYYRHIYKNGLAKFKRFAVEVWNIPADGTANCRTDEEVALAGIEALENFILEIGLPVTLRDLGVDEKTDLKAIADSCACVPGAYKVMTHEEILAIFKECY